MQRLHKHKGGGAAMQDAAQTPTMLIHKMSTGFVMSQALYAVAKLGIPDFIGEESVSARELARKGEVDETTLYRVIRALAGFGVLHEDDNSHFSLTPAGHLLRSDHPQSLRDVVIFRGEENYDAFRALAHSVRTGENAFSHVFGAPRFEYLKSSDEANTSFQAAMKSITRGDIAAILNAYDFTSCSTIVDIGGGNGAFLSAILSQNPHLSGILFDQAPTVELARAGAGGGLSNCQLIAGDFFKSVPAGGDLYVLKSVIHDWPDDSAVAILRNCCRAMGEDAKLLVIDRFIGEPNEESYALIVDLTVLVEHGGRVRRKSEFKTVFSRAGLKLLRVIETESTFHLMELMVDRG
jgi:O-methyltransferase/methyltransferase family protein